MSRVILLFGLVVLISSSVIDEITRIDQNEFGKTLIETLMV